MRAAAGLSNWRIGLLVAALLASPAARLSGQATTVSTTGGALRVQAPGFGFLQGELLDRLRDGRSLLVDFELAVFADPGGTAVAEGRQRFNLSFDLWEERFAVTRIGTPPRSISHLTSKSAEAWCLDQLTVPLGELGRLGRDAPIWIRLGYRVQRPASDEGSNGQTLFTLRALIDLLSRRQDNELAKSVTAGPFRLPR
jgi:hypothetical protein